MSVGAVSKVYPSVRYHLDTNRSPSVIRADTFWATTGGRGQGIKIGVVDDGIDSTNPFFNPAGFTYPAGFPKGGRKWTTPKVIVARAFPGPGSGRQGHLRALPAGLVPRHARRRDRRGRCRHDRPGRARPPDGHRPLGRRAARVARQLPRLQRAGPTGGLDAFTPEIVPPSRRP